jgi:hypothetical protein
MPIPELCLGTGGPGTGGPGPGTGGPGTGTGGGASGSGWPTLSVVTEMEKSLQIALFEDLTGEVPRDLTGVTRARFMAKEMLPHTVLYIDKDLTLETPLTDGIVTLELVPDDLPYAGIWYASVALYDAEDDLIAEHPMFLEVRKGLGHTIEYNTPISIAEIRLMARDIDPEANELLLNYEWDDTEISFAIMRPVDEWNEALPPVKTYTAATFPYRENWRKATIGYLMRTASRKYLRDDLTYQAGGISINEKRKWDAYGKLGDQLIEEWRTWMKQEKVRQNSLQCYRHQGTPAFGGWRVY